MSVLDALAQAPSSLAELQAATGLPKATAHRVVGALEAHGLVRREADGRFTLGLRLVGLGQVAEARFPLWQAAWPVLVRLREQTGESVQLFVRQGDRRVCVASLESPHGLRWIVPVGAVLPLDRGSAGRVLATSSARPTSRRSASAGESPANRRPMWIESVEEREAGVASVSAPVRARGQVIAAVSVSGPLERLSRSPGQRYGDRVASAALAIEAAAGLR
jgi:DNA-binding IclR family transcriptional regulator